MGIVLFVVALGLRSWGLCFGLPHSFSGDEVNKRDAALALAQEGFLHTPSQPSMLYNSLFLVYAAAQRAPHPWTDAEYVYLGRLWMAVLGSLAVVAAWLLGSAFGRRVGIVAGVLLAVLPLHTTASRYIKEDAPLSLMATASVVAALAHARHPSRARLALAGLCAGLAASTKYSGILMLLPAMLSLGASWRRRAIGPSAVLRDLAALVGATAAGFFLVSPVYALHPGRLLAGLAYQGSYSRTGHDGIAIDPWSEAWTYYLRTGLGPGMTWPLLLLSLVGLVLLLRAAGGWIVSVTAVALYVVFEHGLAKPAPFPARYLMPLVPLLCVAAAKALVTLREALPPGFPPAAAWAALAALFVAPPLVKSAMVADEALHDTRLEAARWMEQNIPAGATLVISESAENLPPSEFWHARWRTDDRDHADLDASWHGVAPYFVITSFRFQRFLDHPEAVPARTAYYRAVLALPLVKEFRPRWLSYGKHSPLIRIHRPAPAAVAGPGAPAAIP